MSHYTYSTDVLIKGHVEYAKDEVFTVADTVVYLEGTILVRDTTSKKLIPYVKATHGSSDFAKYVLPYAVTATATGDIKANVIKSAEYPGLDKDLLVIQADGDATNVDAEVLDQLRDYGINSESFTQRSK